MGVSRIGLLLMAKKFESQKSKVESQIPNFALQERSFFLKMILGSP
jgi:hypothetical protein